MDMAVHHHGTSSHSHLMNNDNNPPVNPVRPFPKLSRWTPRSNGIKEAGLTLVEILISMLIFALIMGGLANLFVATKRHILHAHSRMVASELGRYFLDRLQLHVRQDTWDTSSNYLNIGEYRSPNNPCSDYDSASWLEEPQLNNISYFSAQKVEDKDGLRKVKLIICWEEPAP